MTAGQTLRDKSFTVSHFLRPEFKVASGDIKLIFWSDVLAAKKQLKETFTMMCFLRKINTDFERDFKKVIDKILLTEEEPCKKTN